MRILLGIFFLVASSYAENKVLVKCSQAKSQVIYLDTGKVGKFEKDKMQLVLFYNDKMEMFVDRADVKIIPSKLVNISTNKNILQFLEPVADGSILYTLHTNIGILTVQKSYNMIIKPLMVNTFLKCK